MTDDIEEVRKYITKRIENLINSVESDYSYINFLVKEGDYSAAIAAITRLETATRVAKELQTIQSKLGQ